jgi:hypothetical protein
MKNRPGFRIDKIVDYCYDPTLITELKNFPYPEYMCSLLAGPATFSFVFRLPLSPRPWGLKFHGYRAQNVLMPERRRSWVIGAAPVMALPSPLVTGPRPRLTSHRSSTARRHPGNPARPPLPGPNRKPGDGTPTPPGHYDWSGPEPKKLLVPDLF